MNRRDFLQGALAAGAGLSMPSLIFAPSRPELRMVRTATDAFDMVLSKGPRLRILQVTDTHFGTPSDENREKDKKTEALIKELLSSHEADFVFHTGDFINNDKRNPEHIALPFMAGLGVPWSVVFGNHDHPNGAEGQKTLDDYYASLQNAAAGFAEGDGGARDYCFRLDFRLDRGERFATILAFNTGSPQTGMKVNDRQLAWLKAQMARDSAKGISCPVYVMQHIPTIEYQAAYDGGGAVGRRGEPVCFEIDKGETFAGFTAAKRVRAVFVGHDHVNDYIVGKNGVKLVYGRCTGYSGYGDWQKGGRLIDLDSSTGRGSTRVVLGKDSHELRVWSKTLESAPLQD